MSAVEKLLYIFGAIILAQCASIYLVELLGAIGIFSIFPIGIICGVIVCNLINK